MNIISTIKEMQQTSKNAQNAGLTIAVVPTMGCLHEGHISLIEKAKKVANFVIVTIFVNPTQFGENEDFSEYPRTFAEDSAICKNLAVDVIFAPNNDDMYPKDASTWVEEVQLSKSLCGKSRLGHFRGVTTVVTKLFNATLPDKAVFGQKDAQQALIIKRMIRDLNFPIEMIISPTVREEDGLARSSRNRFLSEQQRANAPFINTALKEIKSQLIAPHNDISIMKLKNNFCTKMTDIQGVIDYIEIIDANSLAEISQKQLQKLEKVDILVAIAVFFGNTRLIDNELIIR